MCTSKFKRKPSLPSLSQFAKRGATKPDYIMHADTQTTTCNNAANIDVPHVALIQLRQKDIAAWRTKLLAQQNSICLVCQTKISDSDKPALDHQHGKKGVKIGDNKSGLVRGVLHDQCNRFEGACVVYVLYCLFVSTYHTNIYQHMQQCLRV